MKRLQEVMEVLYETYRLPSIWIDLNKTVIYEQPGFEAINLELFDIMVDNPLPQIRTTAHYQNYIGIPITKEYEAEGMLLLGPSVYTAVTEEVLKQARKEIPIQEISSLVRHYQRFPILAFDELNRIAALAYYMIYGKRIQVENIIEYNFYKVHAAMSAERKLDRILSIARQNNTPHPSYEGEKMIFDCIKRGETKELLKLLNRPLDGEVGALSKNDPVRSMKNTVITFTGIASRTMIEAGIPYEVAYSLNDAYGQLIEETLTVESAHSLMVTMLCECSELVGKFKEKTYSKVVNRCLDYVHSHLYEEISLMEMSKELHFNPNYISRVFKKEVGVTISQFVSQVRVEEAKKLLTFTDYTIMDIVTFLHFHDQSHFTRVFRELTGYTPKKYRDQF